MEWKKRYQKETLGYNGVPLHIGDKVMSVDSNDLDECEGIIMDINDGDGYTKGNLALKLTKLGGTHWQTEEKGFKLNDLLREHDGSIRWWGPAHMIIIKEK